MSFRNAITSVIIQLQIISNSSFVMTSLKWLHSTTNLTLRCCTVKRDRHRVRRERGVDQWCFLLIQQGSRRFKASLSFGDKWMTSATTTFCISVFGGIITECDSIILTDTTKQRKVGKVKRVERAVGLCKIMVASFTFSWKNNKDLAAAQEEYYLPGVLTKIQSGRLTPSSAPTNDSTMRPCYSQSASSPDFLFSQSPSKALL
ncbi:hypothetical protein CHARACLAT_017511 [Characodon lateralis]|uniref:Uncharacterized protein n=1 Tax=Characodon lateralis TaxID=208331 RepID=A0ABU7EDP9_9TELE|nr:hypothetical protein [Characodon lateralis]